MSGQSNNPSVWVECRLRISLIKFNLLLIETHFIPIWIRQIQSKGTDNNWQYGKALKSPFSWYWPCVLAFFYVSNWLVSGIPPSLSSTVSHYVSVSVICIRKWCLCSYGVLQICIVSLCNASLCTETLPYSFFLLEGSLLIMKFEYVQACDKKAIPVKIYLNG